MPEIIMTDAEALRLDADLVEGLLGMRQRRGFKWDEDTLSADLALVGVTFTSARMSTILTELVTRGRARAATVGDPAPPSRP